MSWLGAYVLRSTDGGATWSEPIPVNARPLKHAGLPARRVADTE